MSGAIWARCLVPPKLGDSSAAAELIMATVATKEVMAYRMQAEELGHGLRAPRRCTWTPRRCSTAPRRSRCQGK